MITMLGCIGIGEYNLAEAAQRIKPFKRPAHVWDDLQTQAVQLALAQAFWLAFGRAWHRVKPQRLPVFWRNWFSKVRQGIEFY